MVYIFIVFVLLVLLIVTSCHLAVIFASKNRIYSDLDKIPHREIGLILGAPPLGRSGRPNQFYCHRIDAAEALYKTGKVNRFIISGGKDGDSYDEPESMRKDLLRRGIPDSVMVLDKKGFRTINSVMRAKEVFKADSVTIISQKFHNERSLFLANHKGIDAIAYNATNTSSRKWKFLMILREGLARVKATLEVLR